MVKNKIYKGDCLELLPKHVKDKSVDMILCDLPYGTTKCKWDSIIDLDRLWVEYERVIKDNGAILLFAQTPFDKVLGTSNLKLLRYEWIWEKTKATGHLNAKKMPMKAHENILVFYKNLPIYNPQKTTGHKPVNSYTKSVKNGTADGVIYGKTKKVSGGGNTDRYPRSVQVFSSDTQKSKLHPMQKPLALIEYMIKTYTNEGDLILDNTCGSGTTGLGAKNLNRNYIMMEKDPEFYKIACERVGVNFRDLLELLLEKITTNPSQIIHKNFSPHKYSDNYCLCVNSQELFHDEIINELEYSELIKLIKSNTPSDKTHKTHWYEYDELNKRVKWIKEQISKIDIFKEKANNLRFKPL